MTLLATQSQASSTTLSSSSAALPLAGGVRVQLQLSPLAQGRVQLAAHVSCQRPDVGRALVGLSVPAAWQRLPHLVSLCPVAQQRAAAQAFSALTSAQAFSALCAGNIQDAVKIQAPPMPLLAAEWMREHSWQNWQLLALDSDAMPFLPDTRILRQPEPQLWDGAFTRLCGVSAEAFCALASYDDWLAWMQNATAPYPALLQRHLSLLSFGAQSTSTMSESGSLGRQYAHPLIRALMAQYGNGIAVRLMARWLEMARLIVEPSALFISSEDEHAHIATVQQLEDLCAWQVCGHAMASRGRLSHRITVQQPVAGADAKIVRWEIDAPTDRYFAAGGLLAQSLTGQTADNRQQALRATELLLRAIDPCVGFEICCE